MKIPVPWPCLRLLRRCITSFHLRLDDLPDSFRYIRCKKNRDFWPVWSGQVGSFRQATIAGTQENDDTVPIASFTVFSAPGRTEWRKTGEDKGSSITLPCWFLLRRPHHCRLRRPEPRRRISRCQPAVSAEDPRSLAGCS